MSLLFHFVNLSFNLRIRLFYLFLIYQVIHCETTDTLVYSVGGKNISRSATCYDSVQNVQSYYYQTDTKECNNISSEDYHICNPFCQEKEAQMAPVSSLHKCCPLNEKLNLTLDSVSGLAKYNCIPTSHQESKWDPALFASANENNFKSHVHLENIENFRYEIGFPNCSNGELKMFRNNEDIWFQVIVDGSVVVGLSFWLRPVWLPVQHFCTDEIISDAQGLEEKFGNESSHDIYHKNQILLYCEIQRFPEFVFHRKLFGSLCILSVLWILSVLVIYMVVWDKKNFPLLVQINFFIPTVLVCFVQGVRTLSNPTGLEDIPTPQCIIIAALAQYLYFVMTAAWSVMCFDLLRTFWTVKAIKKTTERIKRLAFYLLFSWGLPIIFVAFAFHSSHTKGVEEKRRLEGVYAFAYRRCSSPIRDQGFGTQSILYVTNVCFFLGTAFFIWKQRRSANNICCQIPDLSRMLGKLKLFGKLLIVMGVVSLSVPIDYLFGNGDPLSTFEVCLRAIHFLPSLAVLFIFGINRRNCRILKQKYPKIEGLFGVFCTKQTNGNESKLPAESGIRPDLSIRSESAC